MIHPDLHTARMHRCAEANGLIDRLTLAGRIFDRRRVPNYGQLRVTDAGDVRVRRPYGWYELRPSQRWPELSADEWAVLMALRQFILDGWAHEATVTPRVAKLLAEEKIVRALTAGEGA